MRRGSNSRLLTLTDLHIPGNRVRHSQSTSALPAPNSRQAISEDFLEDPQIFDFRTRPLTTRTKLRRKPLFKGLRKRLSQFSWPPQR